MSAFLRRLDHAVYSIERLLIVGLLALMASAVFADAMHRVFSAGEGRVERLLVALLPEAQAELARRVLAPALIVLVTWGLVYLAFRTAERKEPMARKPAAVYATLVTAALGGATQALVHGLPNGLVWSQQMALCFMLWVGFLGASLATRDRTHIALEVAGKIWPARMKPAVDVLCRVVAAGFCLFLAVLSVKFTIWHYGEWAESEGAAGVFEGFEVPRFAIFGFLPIPFAIMTLRFLGYGVTPPEDAG